MAVRRWECLTIRCLMANVQPDRQLTICAQEKAIKVSLALSETLDLQFEFILVIHQRHNSENEKDKRYRYTWYGQWHKRIGKDYYKDKICVGFLEIVKRRDSCLALFKKNQTS